MFHRLLVPIDGGLEGFELAERAIDVAASLDATLHVVFVEELDPGFTQRGLAYASQNATTNEVEEADASLAHVAESAADAGVDCRTTVVRGQRHVAILNASRAARADLIVLKAPDRSRWRRLPITTADRVFRNAAASVLILDM